MSKKDIKAEIERITAEIADLWDQFFDISQEINGLTSERNRVEASIVRLRREKELLDELRDNRSALYARWRASVGDFYYSLYMHDEDGDTSVCMMEEKGWRIDDINWNKGYYFRTREEAQECLENYKKPDKA